LPLDFCHSPLSPPAPKSLKLTPFLPRHPPCLAYTMLYRPEAPRLPPLWLIQAMAFGLADPRQEVTRVSPAAAHLSDNTPALILIQALALGLADRMETAMLGTNGKWQSAGGLPCGASGRRSSQPNTRP
jgi:hypothetical protein